MNRNNAGLTKLEFSSRARGSTPLTLCLIVMGVAVADAQQIAKTQKITGQVVDASTPSAGVAGARVTLTSGQSGTLGTATTDSSGQFAFENVEAGRYRVDVRSDGYLPAAYGQRWPSGPSTEVETEGSRSSLTIWAWRESSIAGKLAATDGQPLVGATVTMFQSSRFTRDTVTSVRTTVTDENGAYKFERLSPGRYYVGSLQRYHPDLGCRRAYQNSEFRCQPLASDGSLPSQKSDAGDSLVYETAFYPSSSDLASAIELAVKAGETRTGVDLVLRLQPGRAVYGQVSGPDGPLGQTEISIIRRANLLSGIGVEPIEGTAMTDPDGRFVLIGVVPGDYELRARHLPRTGPDLEYRLPNGIIGGVAGGISAVSRDTPVLETAFPFEVNEVNEQRLNVELRRASNVTLRLSDVSADKGRVQQTWSGLQVRLLPVGKDVHALTGIVDSGNNVEFPSVSAARYRVVLPARKGWAVRGIDGLPAEGLEEPMISIRCCYSYIAAIDLTDRPTSLAGDVRDATGAIVGAADVVIFPSNQVSTDARDPERFKWLQTKDGRFSTNSLPPGDYVVVALPDGALPFDWRDPEVIRSLAPMGVRTSLKEGQSNSVVVVSRSRR